MGQQLKEKPMRKTVQITFTNGAEALLDTDLASNSAILQAYQTGMLVLSSEFGDGEILAPSDKIMFIKILDTKGEE